MPAAATAGCLSALAQCSVRMRVPNSGCSAAAMSPTAKMSGSLVRSDESTSTPPSPRARPACLGEREVGRRADRDQDGVGVDRGPVAELEPGRFAAGGGDFLHGCPSRRSTPCSRCSVGEHLADLAAERGQQRKLRHFDDRDVDAAVSGTGGDLEADPSAADDGQRTTFGQCRIQRVGVVDGAQVVHAVGVCAGDRRPARLRAGGQQQLVVAHRAAVGQGDGVRRPGRSPTPRCPAAARCGGRGTRPEERW